MSAYHEAVPHTPFMGDDNALLPPPVAPSMLDSGFSSPRESAYSALQAHGTPSPSTHLIDSNASIGIEQGATEKAFREKDSTIRHKRKSSPLLVFSGLVAFVIVVLAVILPVYFLVIRPKQHHTGATAQPATGTGSTGSGPNPTSVSNAIMGGDGSLVTASDGSTFTYHNPFGGFWVEDPSDPFSNAARPQSWVPALNESWTFGTDLIHGCEHATLFGACNRY